jgi:hypothetical protein
MARARSAGAGLHSPVMQTATASRSPAASGVPAGHRHGRWQRVHQRDTRRLALRTGSSSRAALGRITRTTKRGSNRRTARSCVASLVTADWTACVPSKDSAGCTPRPGCSSGGLRGRRARRAKLSHRSTRTARLRARWLVPGAPRCVGRPRATRGAAWVQPSQPAVISSRNARPQRDSNPSSLESGDGQCVIKQDVRQDEALQNVTERQEAAPNLVQTQCDMAMALIRAAASR